MLIVLIILGLILGILLLIFLIVCSTIKIEIKELNLNNLSKEYLIYIRLYIFGIIRWFGIKIDEKKVNKFQNSKLLRWIDRKVGVKPGEETKEFLKLIYRDKRKIVSKDFYKRIKKLKIQIEKINFNLYIGLENVILTSFLVTFISSITSIILARNIEDISKSSYKIKPIYNSDKIFYKLNFNGIIKTKIIYILRVI